MTDRATWRLVVGGTLLLAGAAAWFVLRFGSDLPFVDEWDLLPEMFGGRFGWGWVWGWHNEHRYPAGKLVWAAGLWATGYHFQTGGFVSVGLLAAAAVLLADAARRVRGHASAGDLLPAAVLLHWGHGYTLLMGYQTTFVLFTLALAGAAWAAARGLTAAGLGFAGLAVTSGAFGLAAAPALAAGLAWGGRRRPGLLAAAAAVVGYTGWVAANLPLRPPLGAGTPWPTLVLAAGQYTMVGWGLPVIAPDAGVRLVAGLATLALMWAVGAGVVRLARTPDGRPLGVALAALLAAHLGVAAAVAWGRNGGLIDRMVTPAAAGLGVAWVAAAGRVPGWVGLAAAVVVVAANIGPGWEFGAAAREANRRLEADIRAGMAPVFLAGKHGGSAEALVGERMAPTLRLLRDAGAGQFRLVGPDPAHTTAPAAGPFPLLLTCDAGPFRPGGPPPPRVPLTPPGRPVIGLRVAVEQHHDAKFQSLWLHWAGAAGGRHRAEVFPLVVPGRAGVVFPLAGDPAAVWLEPGCPVFGLTLEAAEWLVAPGS